MAALAAAPFLPCGCPPGRFCCHAWLLVSVCLFSFSYLRVSSLWPWQGAWPRTLDYGLGLWPPSWPPCRHPSDGGGPCSRQPCFPAFALSTPPRRRVIYILSTKAVRRGNGTKEKEGEGPRATLGANMAKTTSKRLVRPSRRWRSCSTISAASRAQAMQRSRRRLGNGRSPNSTGCSASRQPARLCCRRR